MNLQAEHIIKSMEKYLPKIQEWDLDEVECYVVNGDLKRDEISVLREVTDFILGWYDTAQAIEDALNERE